MTTSVIEHLNRSIRQIDQNMEDAIKVDNDIGLMRTAIFIKNAKNIAESNERIWDRISNARKNKK